MTTSKTELTRRSALAAFGSAAMASSLAAPSSAQSASRTFVLVHGAWHGGWCWRRVSDRLERKGHKVYAPSLTGLADRAHLISQQVNVTTHVTDIANLIRYEDLRDVVLVGHSYAGFVISGVAEKSREAIRSIVFLDAYVPLNGQSVLSLGSQGMRDNVNAAIKRGQTGMAPASAAYFSVNAKDRAYVDRKCTPQPVGTYGEAIVLTGAREKIGRKTYIRAKGWNAPGFDNVVTRLRGDASWNLREIACGHDAMIDMPDRLTEMLIEAA